METKRQTQNERAAIVYEIAQKDPEINIVQKIVPFAEGQFVTDFYIETQSEKTENAKFFSSEEFHKNFRRGVTLLTSEKSGSSILRKGFQKFKEEPQGVLPSGVNKLFDSKQVYLYKTAESPIKFNHIPLVEKKGIKIYRTFKQDGSNIQISWCESVNAWAISSKNNCNLLQTEADSKTQELNQIQVETTKLWFEFLKRISDVTLKALKSYFSSRTLIGELCGKGQLRQYVPYERDCLYFYAIIENDADTICFPPQKAEKVFKILSLPFKESCSSPIFTSYQDILNELNCITKEVESGSFKKYGEGEVLYFTLFTLNKQLEEQEEVIYMMKVKNLEYKVIAGIFECTSKISLKKELDLQIKEATKRFDDSILHRIFKEDKISKEPIEHYKQVFEQVIELIKKYNYKINRALLSETIEIIQKSIKINENITPELITKKLQLFS